MDLLQKSPLVTLGKHIYDTSLIAKNIFLPWCNIQQFFKEDSD